MDDPNRERLEPINPPTRQDIRKTPSTPYEFWSKLTRFIAVLAGLLVLILCVYLWLGFMENDQGVWHLLSAFALCFGVGALAYGPLFVMAYWAHKSAISGPRKSWTLLSVFLILPWMIIGAMVVPIGGFWPVAGIGIVFLCLYFLFWTVLGAHRLRTVNSRNAGE